MGEEQIFFESMADRIYNLQQKDRRNYFEVDNADLHEVVESLFRVMSCRLSTATAAETYRGIEVLYHFSHDATGTYFCPRIVMTDKENPRMYSITPIVTGAEWIEREMAEFWGIEFLGHPRPERLLSKDHPHNLDKPIRFGGKA